jgi:alpha-1,2-mannosyltransferase
VAQSLTGRARFDASRLTRLYARHGTLLLRLGAVLAGAVAVKSFFIDPLTGHFAGEFEDFSAYIGAARSMAHGASPYAAFDGSTVVMSGFDYPPFAAVLLQPLALLSDRAALLVWLALSVACGVSGAIVVARTVLPATWPRVELAVIAALAFAPAAYNYWHGQINTVMFLFLALAFRAYTRDHRLRTGVLLGVAAGIKLAPILLIVLLLRRKWWRASLAMIGTAAATAVVGVLALGFVVTRDYVANVLPVLNRGTGWIYNESLGGLVNRVFEHSVLRVQASSLLVTLLSLAGAVVAIGLAAWVVRPGERPAVERGGEFGLGVTATVLAGSIAWFPHFVHLLIPLFAAAGLVAAQGASVGQLRRAALAAIAAFGLLAPLVIALLTADGLAGLGSGVAWWLFLQLCSLPCAAAVWLGLALGRSLRAATGGKSLVALR